MILIHQEIPEEKLKGLNPALDHLLTSGFSPKYSGFYYLLTAVKLIGENRGYLKVLTKNSGLYTTIAKQYDTTPHRVLQSIRYAIKKAAQTQAFGERFGRYLEHLPLAPANGEFLALAAELLKLGGEKHR